MLGVPIGTAEYVFERAMEVVRDGGADRLAHCLATVSYTHLTLPTICSV